MTHPSLGRKPASARASLRSELLFKLAFLAAAALLLALWTTGVLRLSSLPPLQGTALLVLLLLLDLVIFVVLGNHLLERLVLRPLADTVAVAEAIAAGDYGRRIPTGRTREMAALADALNRLTDQLLQNQSRLTDNVRSLDETNQLLHETQRELVQAEKMASIGRFSAGIAHEIGNPLGALVGYAAVLRKRGADPELVAGIDREARRIDQIVRMLLDYARPGNAPREPVDVNLSVSRMLDLLRAQGQMDTVELRLDLAPELPCIEAVPTRMDQMFLNLFANAVAAMSWQGRLTVVTRRERYAPERPAPTRRADDPPGVNYAHLRRARHSSVRDAHRLEPDRDVIRVVVADSGPGIPPEHIHAVFDPFFTTKAPGQGTGLGLAIVASTVAELGGRIEVSSAEGGGTTFYLYFPVLDTAA